MDSKSVTQFPNLVSKLAESIYNRNRNTIELKPKSISISIPRPKGRQLYYNATRKQFCLLEHSS